MMKRSVTSEAGTPASPSTAKKANLSAMEADGRPRFSDSLMIYLILDLENFGGGTLVLQLQ